MKNALQAAKDEQLRLRALSRYDILDTISEEEYDSITKIAAQICNAPVSLITLLDKDRQWFKSHYGTDIQETVREIAFCNHTIKNNDEMLIVPDLREDERFAKNPLVTQDPRVVFYAGAQLITPDGFILGSICVLDIKRSELNEDQKFALRALSRLVISKFELRRKIKQLKITQQKFKRASEESRKFARIVSHDIKTPVACISLLTEAFQKKHEDVLDESANNSLDIIHQSAKELQLFIDGVLDNSEKSSKTKRNQKAESKTVIKKVINMVGYPSDVEIKLEGEFPKVNMDKTSLQQIFQNLVTNAIKYNDKQKGLINIVSKSDEQYHYFNVSDNGPGIKKSQFKKIFKEGETLGTTDRFGGSGTGLGLSTVKDIIESHGGKVTLTSEPNMGSDFRFSIPKFKKVS